MNEVISAINSIYCSTIDHIDFDVEKKEIRFDLTLKDNGQTTYHNITFFDVTAFLWIESSDKNSLYNYSNCDFYELTSISLRKINVNSKDAWFEQYLINFNIAIEIWETALLINASKISIDNKSYSV